VLLACATLITGISVLLPFASHPSVMLVLLVLAGLTAGTFYPLTLSLVLRNFPMKYVFVGIAMYAMDILFTTNFATALEAWYVGHLSWRWILWNSAAVTPVMMALIYFGIPRQPLPRPKAGQPHPNWRGFLYASLGFALLYIALDQGQRLDWLNSGTVLALIAAGVCLLLTGLVQRWRTPDPLINLTFLVRRNTLLLGAVLIFFRFVMLATVVAIPSYLGPIKGYLPLQTGPVLLWVALPQCIFGLFSIYLLRFIDARLIPCNGVCLSRCRVPHGCRTDCGLVGHQFLVAAVGDGYALSFNGIVGAIILELINTGALTRPIDVLTFSGYFLLALTLGTHPGGWALGPFTSPRKAPSEGDRLIDGQGECGDLRKSIAWWSGSGNITPFVGRAGHGRPTPGHF
jgi:DHA2 family multidrug resistance protein